MKNLKRKNLVLALLVLFALAISGTTYAYWASIDNSEVVGTTVNIGSGRTVTTTASLAAFDVSLVPAGQEDNSNESNAASSVTLTYTLNYTDTAAYATATAYTVEISNKLLSDLTPTRIDELFTFVVTADESVTAGTPDTITILVTFANEPTEAEYAGIIADDLTFDVTFTTTPVVNPGV